MGTENLNTSFTYLKIRPLCSFPFNFWVHKFCAALIKVQDILQVTLYIYLCIINIFPFTHCMTIIFFQQAPAHLQPRTKPKTEGVKKYFKILILRSMKTHASFLDKFNNVITVGKNIFMLFAFRDLKQYKLQGMN